MNLYIHYRLDQGRDRYLTHRFHPHRFPSHCKTPHHHSLHLLRIHQSHLPPYHLDSVGVSEDPIRATIMPRDLTLSAAWQDYVIHRHRANRINSDRRNNSPFSLENYNSELYANLLHIYPAAANVFCENATFSPRQSGMAGLRIRCYSTLNHVARQGNSRRSDPVVM